MVIKGYYASICQGMTFIFNFFTYFEAVGLIVMGGLLATDNAATLVNSYRYVGIGMAAMGGSVAVASTFAILGARKDIPKKLKIGMILGCINIGLLLVLMGVMMSMGSQAHGAVHDTFFALDGEARAGLEQKYSCCGFDDSSEAETNDCKWKATCSGPLSNSIESSLKTGSMVAGAGAGLSLAASMFTFCLWLKAGKRVMTKQEKMMTLADQARVEHSGPNRAKAEKEERALGLIP